MLKMSGDLLLKEFADEALSHTETIEFKLMKMEKDNGDDNNVSPALSIERKSKVLIFFLGGYHFGIDIMAVKVQCLWDVNSRALRTVRLV